MPIDYRFWRAPSGSNFDNTDSWAYTSGGIGGAPVPGINDIAIFDGSGVGSCLLNTDMSVAGMWFRPEYPGMFSQSSNVMHIGTQDASFDGGIFVGSSENIEVTGSFFLRGCRFISTNGTLSVEKNFHYDKTFFGGEGEEIAEEEFILSSSDISGGYVTLARIPIDATNVALNIIAGSTQNYGIDYTVSDVRLIWSGLALDGMLSEGDMIRTVYSFEDSGSNFEHSSGKVEVKAENNLFFGGGIELFDMEFGSDRSNAITVDSSAFVENDLFLLRGYFNKGTDATIHARGDVQFSEFGRAGANYQVLLRMEGNGRQFFTSENESIIPSLTVDKSSEEQVIARGDSPIKIDGDFRIVYDSTFNTNELSLDVGNV